MLDGLSQHIALCRYVDFKQEENMEYTACLVMDVVLDGYTGDWQSAIDEAFRVSKTIGVPVKLVYANQKVFYITPDASHDEINELKQKRVVIGV